ncbi:hypothetical protein RclHR1_05740007 [Rhizophagus clarus]|uniref:Ion transport domain-containing protein n=1 Tax=Rhizophagus clarus TaxID=94130 RepID=A0A2Z6S1B0_9GLOM|nr:hypothetical protein RclHR1_05740007 [Rhizophagus clarus]
MSSGNTKTSSSSETHQYQIAISLDGRFVVTFDTINLLIKVLKNTDYRPFVISNTDEDETSSTSQNESSEITEIVASFKINRDLTINKLYELNSEIKADNKNSPINRDDIYKWSIDLSNLQEYPNGKYIFIAVSRMDNERIINEINYKKKNVEKNDFHPNAKPQNTAVFFNLEKGTAIYRLKINAQLRDENQNEVFKNIIYNIDNNCSLTYYRCECVSGIPRFIEDLEPNLNDEILRKFIVLSLNGIYNFEYNKGGDKEFTLTEKFDYPKSIKLELEKTQSFPTCMEKLITSLYDKYLLVEHYKNGVQALEVYDLIQMKQVTMAKRTENRDHLKKYNKYTFSVSKQKLQFCFTRGLHTIKLHFIENGLEFSTKNLYGTLDKIHSLEFIDNDEKLLIVGEVTDEEKMKILIWDIYNTCKVTTILIDKSRTIEDFNIHWTRTSGNILQINGKGEVTSFLKIVDTEIRKQKNSHIKNIDSDNLKTKLNKNDMEGYAYQKKSSVSADHTLYFDEKTKDFESIVESKEPWIMDDYERTSFCLRSNENETLQLIVGRSSVQIWHQIKLGSNLNCKGKLTNEGEPFLQFIWTNGIPVDQENQANRLQIEEIIFGLDYYRLEVSWCERGIIKKRTIEWQDINENMNGVKYACKALEHLNKRSKDLMNYFNKHCYEEMIAYINNIIWRFIDHKPDEYRLLDVRHNVMRSLILGDSDQLIKFILFGNEESNSDDVKHIPRSIMWKKDRKFICDDLDPFESRDDTSKPRKTVPTNDLELAIYHWRELKDTIIVAYLLEYYSRHAKDSAGWMCTVSKALPLLYKYHYDDYARKLFRKECFANQDHFSAQDPYDIIPKSCQSRHFQDKTFMAFRPEDTLKSDRVLWTQQPPCKRIYNKVSSWYYKTHYQKPPIALRVVPLPGFTVTINEITKEGRKTADYSIWKILTNILWFIFIPRSYKVGKSDNHLLSPFAKVIKYENDDDMYDNPATEAIIDFRWRKARTFFVLLFLRFIIYAICFGVVSWTYLVHDTIGGKFRVCLVVLIALFYYLSSYLIVTEIIQIAHYRKRYFRDIYNYFDLLSIIFPTAVMFYMLLSYFQLSDGFGSVKVVEKGLVVGITFSIFILWIEFILYLRLISCKYVHLHLLHCDHHQECISVHFIHGVVNHCVRTHNVMIVSKFVLVKNPEIIQINYNTFSGNAISTTTNERFDINIKSDYNASNPDDNPFNRFLTSMKAIYLGNWIQDDVFNFWAIDVLSLIASIFLISILQNMFITLMSGIYEQAATKGRQALLRYRARQIADYEALYHIHLRPHEPDPKYIYYIGRSKNFEEWQESRKNDQDIIYKGFENKSKINIFKKFVDDEFSIWKYNDDDDDIK